MKKIATALAIALAFAAPMAFSTSAVQARTVKSQPHMTKSVHGNRHKVKQHKAKSVRGKHHQAKQAAHS